MRTVKRKQTMKNKKYKFPIASIFFVLYGVLRMYGEINAYCQLNYHSGVFKEQFYINILFAGIVLLMGVMLIIFKNSYLLLIPTISLCLLGLYQIYQFSKTIFTFPHGLTELIADYNWIILIDYTLALTAHIILVAIVVMGKIKSLELLLKYTWWGTPIIYGMSRIINSIYVYKMMLGSGYSVEFFRVLFLYSGIIYLFIIGTFFMGKFIAYPYREEVAEDEI